MPRPGHQRLRYALDDIGLAQPHPARYRKQQRQPKRYRATPLRQRPVVTAVHLAGRPGDDVWRHLHPTRYCGPEQGAIAEQIDQTRHAAGIAVHPAQSGGGEQGSVNAGYRDAVIHVGRRLANTQGLEVEARSDALIELSQVWRRKHAAQLGLANQEDLQELVLGGLEIGQQSNLLHDLRPEILRLVDDQHRPSATGMGVEQKEVQTVHQRLRGLLGSRHIEAELVADGMQELHPGQRRIQHQRNVHALGQLLQKGATDRGLAGTHLAGQEHEAAAVAGTIEEMRQGLTVLSAQEQILRVRRDGETGLFQAKVLGIHFSDCNGPYRPVWLLCPKDLTNHKEKRRPTHHPRASQGARFSNQGFRRRATLAESRRPTLEMIRNAAHERS